MPYRFNASDLGFIGQPKPAFFAINLVAWNLVDTSRGRAIANTRCECDQTPRGACWATHSPASNEEHNRHGGYQ
jgi:hypothetical protein